MSHGDILGIVGTGALGSALARAGLEHGITTSVWNRTPTRTQPLVALGAAPRSTVGDLVESASVVVTTVPTYAEVRAVLTDVSLRGRTIVNLTSGTPADAAALAAEVHLRGGRYVDGAAMGGTELVGDPSATFFYSGDEDAFAQSRRVLGAFGKPLFLGSDPATSSAYDTATLGMILGFLTASYQALALLRRQGIPVQEFASVIRDYWPFVLNIFDKQSRQISSGAITADDGTIDVYLVAIQHLIDSSAAMGVDTAFSEAIASLLRRASDAGRGDGGLAHLAETFLHSEETAQ